MTSKIFAFAVCGTFSLMAVAARAQTPAAAPQPAPVQAAAAAAEAAAPAIPGICVYSQELTIGNSIVGKYVAQRLQQLEAQTNAEVNDTYTKLQADNKTIGAQAATMTPEQRQQAGTGLQQRADQLQQLAQVRQREMQLTQQTAVGQIVQSLNPLIVDSFSAHKCSILIDRNATLLAASTMEITADLTARLDSKIQQFAFDRATLPEEGAPNGQAAAAPGPARPAAAAPGRPAAPAAKPAAPAAGTPARTRR
jgi:Skp family chaperone for outer membrane proteins